MNYDRTDRTEPWQEQRARLRRTLLGGVALLLALGKCTGAERAPQLGEPDLAVASVSVREGSVLRADPADYDGGMGHFVLGDKVVTLGRGYIDALSANNTNPTSADAGASASADILTPDGINVLKDKNGAWYSLPAKNVINGACSQKTIDLLEKDAVAKLSEACKDIADSLEGREYVWVNDQTATPHKTPNRPLNS